MKRPATATAIALAGAGAVVAGLPAFLLRFRVWSEILAPAYFTSLGRLLYREIFFPHTPLLILGTGLLGKLFGFSAPLFRAEVFASMGACGALIVMGTRPHRKEVGGPIAGLLAGVPFFVLWTVYLEGPSLWPDPFIAPLVLGAALAFERFERTALKRPLLVGGLLLGLAILVKQTAAWIAGAALLWTLLASRRRGTLAATLLAASVAAPYALFAVGWAVVFGTLSHLRWTLLVPVSGDFAAQIKSSDGLSTAVVLKTLAIPLIVPAEFLLRRCLPATQRLRSPAPWLVLGCFCLAWPRWGLLHLAASSGLIALLAARALLLAWTVGRRPRRRATGRPSLSYAFGGSLLLIHAAVALLSGGSLIRSRIGGAVFRWDDPATEYFAAEVRARVPKGGSFLNFYRECENLYAITGTTTPDGTYANATFWYVLARDGIGERIMSSLALRPGTLVLFHEPGGPDHRFVKEMPLYRFLRDHTQTVAELRDGATWRVVR